MKTNRVTTLTVKTLTFAILFATSSAFAASWSYRGTLQDGGKEASGRYDLRLTLVDAGGTVVRAPVTLYGVNVEKGSFQTEVDFGLDPKSITGAKLLTEVQQGNSGFFSLGEAKAINGGTAECWDVDGNTALVSSTLGVNDNSRALFHFTNGGANIYLRRGAGFEQGASTASGVSSAAFGSSVAAAANSFALGRGVVGPNGTTSFAYSDVAPSQTGGTPGFSDAPGEFLVRASGGVAFNTVPGTADLAIGPRTASTSTQLRLNNGAGFLTLNAAPTSAAIGANSALSIEALNVSTLSVGAIGFNAIQSELVAAPAFVDYIFRPRSFSSNADVDISLRSSNNKAVGLAVSDANGTLVITPDNVSGGSPRILVGGNSAGIATLSNGGTWTNASSRSFKTGFSSVNALDVLKRVADLPISVWTYKGSEEGQHIGPMAEDFRAAFSVGAADGKSIATVDADGVALAAIQGLNLKLETENAALRAQLNQVMQRLTDLETQ